MTGDFPIGGSAIGFGNEPGDTIDFNTYRKICRCKWIIQFRYCFKIWSKAHLGSIQADDLLFDTNYITTTESNTELRAEGTGKW